MKGNKMEKRVYRSTTEKMIAGVAGGIAEYFEVDPVIVRAAFIILAFFNGIGIIGYIVCIFIIPKAPVQIKSGFGQEATQEVNAGIQPVDPEHRKEGRRRVFGFVLVAIGVLFLLKTYFSIIDLETIFPVLLIIGGIWMISHQTRKGAVSNDLR
jgi:phage shock protein C